MERLAAVKPTMEAERVVVLLAAVVLALTAADHWTTYLCLSHPVPGFVVIEANPLAARLFDALGLLPGLALDSGVTLAGVGFLLVTERVPTLVKLGFLGAVAIWTAAAVFNNLEAAAALGLWGPGLG